MGGKCEFAATAQRLSQFAKADIHATEIYIPDVASPHDRSEPKLPVFRGEAYDGFGPNSASAVRRAE